MGAVGQSEFLSRSRREFLLNHTNCEINIYEKSTSEVYGALKSDVSAGADVFMFTGEYAKELQKINALYKLPDNYASVVRGRDNAYTMAPIESGNGLYGFPATLDNGWYLWYNAAFYNDSEVDSLDDILIKARDMNKRCGICLAVFGMQRRSLTAWVVKWITRPTEHIIRT